MSEQLWIAIIGAIAAVIGAIVSTVSIILTNKNTKKLKFLERSDMVKKEISTKRYEVYKALIDYINSWYDIQPKFKHKYSDCKAKNALIMGIFDHRLKSVAELENELNVVLKLSLNYFYYDGKTYKLLKYLEFYLSSTINYFYNNEIDNKNLFFYIVYCDIWAYIFKISKRINKFINNNDTLKFKHSKSVKMKKAEKLLFETHFYGIFFESEKREMYIKICKDIEKNKKIITQNKKLLKTKFNSVDVEQSEETIGKLKISNAVSKKAKRCLKLKKHKLTKGYNMWKKCKDCEINCIFNVKQKND